LQFTNSQFARIAAYITKVMQAPRIHRNPETPVASNHPELHASGFAISIECHGGLFVARLSSNWKKAPVSSSI
jgi:hypothetical protein